MLEYTRSFIFKCEFVGANALVPNELRTYYALIDVHWMKTFVAEVSIYISGFCVYASVYIGADLRYRDIYVRHAGCR